MTYTISCSPSHNGFYLVLQDAGVRTESGFTPATNYTCTVHATNANGNGPAASDTVRTDDGGLFANPAQELCILFLFMVVGLHLL